MMGCTWVPEERETLAAVCTGVTARGESTASADKRHRDRLVCSWNPQPHDTRPAAQPCAEAPDGRKARGWDCTSHLGCWGLGVGVTAGPTRVQPVCWRHRPGHLRVLLLTGDAQSREQHSYRDNEKGNPSSAVCRFGIPRTFPSASASATRVEPIAQKHKSINNAPHRTNGNQGRPPKAKEEACNTSLSPYMPVNKAGHEQMADGKIG